jgi:hypothetical protein
MLNRIATTLIMGIGLSQLIGCQDVVEHTPAGVQSSSIMDCTAESQPQDGALGTLSCELGLSVQAAGTSLKDELRQMLGSYAHALQSGDAATIEKLLSAELRARIDERGSGVDFASKLQSFVDQEQLTLARSVGVLKAPRESFAITSAEVLVDGSIAAIEVAVNGQLLPKPFYFVQEDDSYKLSLIPPDIGIAAASYRVKNDDLVVRSFSCSGASANVAPLQEVRASCNDTCGIFDGTRFSASGGSADCAYNVFGVDMTISNGHPRCTSFC